MDEITLYVVNIPFLKIEDAIRIKNDLTNKNFQLVEMEIITGTDYQIRHRLDD